MIPRQTRKKKMKDNACAPVRSPRRRIQIRVSEQHQLPWQCLRNENLSMQMPLCNLEGICSEKTRKYSKERIKWVNFGND